MGKGKRDAAKLWTGAPSEATVDRLGVSDAANPTLAAAFAVERNDAATGQRSSTYASRGRSININNAIVDAGSTEEIVLLCRRDEADLDYKNVSTALNQIAKASRKTRELPREEDLLFLISLAYLKMSQFDSRGMVNTMWAFATLRFSPPAHVLDAFDTHMVPVVGDMIPQELANTMFSFATLQRRPSAALQAQLNAHIAVQAARFKTVELANALWGFAALGVQPGEGVPGVPLMTVLALHVDRTLREFSSPELEKTLWAYAALGHRPSEALLARCEEMLPLRISGSAPHTVANLLWALAALALRCGCAWSQALVQRFEVGIHDKLDKFSPQNLSNALWAFGVLGAAPKDKEVRRAVDKQVVAMLDLFTAQEIANVLWAYHKMPWPVPAKAMMQIIDVKVARRANTAAFDAPGLALLVAAYAALGGERPPTPLLKALELNIELRGPQFQPDDAAALTWALATLEHLPGLPCHERIEMMLHKHAESFSAEQIACVSFFRGKCVELRQQQQRQQQQLE
jgi:hypothetical protein